MSDCALVEGLRDRLGVADTGAAVGAIGGHFNVAVSLPAIDLGGLSDITSRLGVDAGPLQAAGGNIAAQLTGVAGGLDPSGMVAPLLRLADQAEQLAGADPAAILQRITSRVSGGSDDGLAKLQRVLGGVSEGVQDGAVQGVVALGRALLPALPESPLAALGTWGGGITTFITLAGGLMAVEGRSRVIQQAPALAWARLSPLREGRLAGLAAWAGNPLLAQVAARPDDAAVQQAVAGYARELVLAVRELEDAVGTAEVTLAYEDPQRIALQLTALEPLLASAGPEPLQALCADLTGRLSRVISDAGNAAGGGLDAQIDQALALVGQLVAAVDAIDAAAISAPVRNALGSLTGGLNAVADGIGTGVGAVTTALHTVRDAVLAVDLRPLADAVRAVIQPLADALQALDALLSTAMTAIGEAMDLAQQAITTAKNAILAAAGALKSAFDNLAAAVRALDLPGKIRDLQGGIQAVAGELDRIRLEPFFDTSRDVMSTAADALRLVPVDILPDDLKAQLAEVCATVRAIDFDSQVRVPLTTQLDAILNEFDTDVLGQVAVFHQQLVDFLTSIDPTQPLADLERRFDEDLIQPLLALDPDALLKPATDAITNVQRRVAAIDLHASVLGPVEDAFAQVLALIDRANPATALQPVADRITALRTQIDQATGLSTWADTLDQAHAQLTGVLDRVDLGELVLRLEAGYQLLLNGLRDVPGGGAIGSLVAMLVQQVVPVSPASWVTVQRWLDAGGAAAEVKARMVEARAQLQAIADLLQATDVAAVVGRLAPMHSQLAAALNALPAEHGLRRRFASVLAAGPAERLAPLSAGRDRLLATARAGTAALLPLANSGFSHTDLARDRLRAGLLPLAALKDQTLGLVRRFGVEPVGRDMGAVFAELLAALRPSRVLAALQPVLQAIKAKIDAIVVAGLVQPLKEGIAALQAILARIDLTPVVAELSGIHAAVRGQIASLSPQALLGDVLAAFDELQQHLASYDPLAPARTAINAFKAAVAALAEPGSVVRPTVLFAGVVSVHHDFTNAVASIDVRNLLKPVLDALHGLVQQLDEGLLSTEDAFGDLQSALPA